MSEIDRYYAILGLAPGASLENIKQAYRALVKRWHPDRFAEPGAKDQAEERFREITEAYEYLKAIPFTPPPEPSAPPTAPTTPLKPRIYTTGASGAEVAYQAGVEHATQGLYEEAIADFSRAIRLDPDYAEAYRYRGFVYSVLGFELGAESDLAKAKALGLTSESSDRRRSHDPRRVRLEQQFQTPWHQRSPQTPSLSRATRWHCAQTLTRHAAAITCIALSPDANLLASSSQDGHIELWNLQTGKPLGRLTGHEGSVWAIAISPDGQLLASAGADQTIQIWYLHDGTRLRRLTGHTGAVRAIAFSPDRKTLISGGHDGTVRLWDIRKGKLKQTVLEFAAPVLSVAVSADQTWLAASASDRSLKIAPFKRLSSGHTLTWDSGAIQALTFHPNSQELATANDEGLIKLWSMRSHTVSAVLVEPTPAVRSLAFGPAVRSSPSTQPVLASGNDAGQITLWQLSTGRPLHTLEAHTGTVTSLGFGPTGLLVSGSADHTIHLWRPEFEQP